MPNLNSESRQLPDEILQKIMGYINHHESVKELRLSSKTLNTLSHNTIHHTKLMLAAYISRHPELTEYQRIHLNSETTVLCLIKRLDTVDNLCAQVTDARLQEVLKAASLLVPGLPMQVPLQSEVQALADALNNWRLERIKMSCALSPTLALESFKLRNIIKQCGALMGLTREQMQDNFALHHLEAICKGHQYDSIKNLSDNQIKALILGENLDILDDPNFSLKHKTLRVLGIPARESMQLHPKVFYAIFECISVKVVTSTKSLKSSVLSSNWYQLYKDLLENIRDVTDLETIDHEVLFKKMLGLSESTVSDKSFTSLNAGLILLGYTVAEARIFTNLEAQALLLGFNKSAVVKLRLSDWFLHSLSQYLTNNAIDTNIADTEYFRSLYGMTEGQVYMSKYYQGDNLRAIKVEPGHMNALWLPWIINKEAMVNEILSKPGIIAFAHAFCLSAEQAIEARFGNMHTCILSNVEVEDDQDFTAATSNLYVQIHDLNGAQAMGMAWCHFEKDYVKSTLVPVENYAVAYKCQEYIAHIEDLQPFQSWVILKGLTFEQVTAHWFKIEHALALLHFGAFFSYDDFNPLNIQDLAIKHDLPAALREYADLSWAHVLAYKRFVPESYLLQVNTIQAFGLAVGLSYAAVKNTSLTITHILAIMPEEDGDDMYCIYNFDAIKDLTPMQVLGAYSGLSIEDVSSAWYTQAHMAAIVLGYNPEFVRNATPEQIQTQIAGDYTCAVDIDLFVEKYLQDYLKDNQVVRNVATARMLT